MSNFKKLSTRSFCPNASAAACPDETYWKSFNFPVTAKESGPITYIDFAPVQDRVFAVSTSAKIQLYSTVTSQAQSSISRFHDAAYGGSFRQDGRLLMAGTEEGRLRLFDVARKSQLRIFNGHKAATHHCKFCNNNVHAVSFSDDKSVVVWDITNEDVVMRFNEHEDYVRAGAVNSSCSNTFISGSYDHKVKMFDIRAQKSTMQVDHGAPVESVLFFPSGGVFVSAGGTEIKVWDALAGGKLIAKMSQHHKTVTCLSLASDNTRLLSGSLDKNVKVYSVENYQVVHTMSFPSAILSLGISSSDEAFAVGMVDGLLSIQNRVQKTTKKMKKLERSSKRRRYNELTEQDTKAIEEKRNMSLTRIDQLLKKFNSSAALDFAMKKYGHKEPEMVIALIQELMRTQMVYAAIGGREDPAVKDLFRFVASHIKNPSFTRVLIDLTVILIDTYEDLITDSSMLGNHVKELKGIVNVELENIKQMMSINGAIDMLLATSSVGHTNNSSVPNLPTITLDENYMDAD